jgi:hypothetical protein
MMPPGVACVVAQRRQVCMEEDDDNGRDVPWLEGT